MSLSLQSHVLLWMLHGSLKRMGRGLEPSTSSGLIREEPCASKKKIKKKKEKTSCGHLFTPCTVTAR